MYLMKNVHTWILNIYCKQPGAFEKYVQNKLERATSLWWACLLWWKCLSALSSSLKLVNSCRIGRLWLHLHLLCLILWHKTKKEVVDHINQQTQEVSLTFGPLLTWRSFRVWIFCEMTNIFFSLSILWLRFLYMCFLIFSNFYSLDGAKKERSEKVCAFKNRGVDFSRLARYL